MSALLNSDRKNNLRRRNFLGIGMAGGLSLLRNTGTLRALEAQHKDKPGRAKEQRCIFCQEFTRRTYFPCLWKCSSLEKCRSEGTNYSQLAWPLLLHQTVAAFLPIRPGSIYFKIALSFAAYLDREAYIFWKRRNVR